jgi:hypothetical protein
MTFGIELPLTGVPAVECRAGGATNDYTIVVTFSEGVIVEGKPQAHVTSGTGTIGAGGVSNGGAVGISGNVVTVPLTNAGDAQTIRVTLNDVNGSTDVVIPMSILIGDVNGNGIVNASDVSQTKAQIGQPLGQNNFRADVTANGIINASDISITKSLTGNGLAQWLPDARLTVDPAFTSTPFDNAKALVVGSSAEGEEILHLIFFDERDGNREIYYKRSTNGGTSWRSDTRLTNNSAVSHFPSIAASRSVVHVVWEEYRDGNAEIYYKRSPDGGLTWGADTRLTNNPGLSLSPSVAASGNVVHVSWYDLRDGNSEIYYKRSADGGLTWGADMRLTNNTAGSTLPAVAVAGTDVHVAWEEYRHGPAEIYYKRSADGGVTWGADTRLTNNGANSFAPSIAASDSDVSVAWFDHRDGNDEIYQKHSGNSGANWGPDTRVTNNAAVSNYPSVSVSGANVHLVWFDERDGNTEIYYNRSADHGGSWGADVRLTNDAARSTDPCVAVSGSNVHVIWTDARDNAPTYSGNYEIYYKRHPAGN